MFNHQPTNSIPRPMLGSCVWFDSVFPFLLAFYHFESFWKKQSGKEGRLTSESDTVGQTMMTLSCQAFTKLVLLFLVVWQLQQWKMASSRSNIWNGLYQTTIYPSFVAFSHNGEGNLSIFSVYFFFCIFSTFHLYFMIVNQCICMKKKKGTPSSHIHLTVNFNCYQLAAN